MSGDFPMRFMQPPAHITDKASVPPGFDDYSDFTSGEVRKMNQEFQEDQKLQEAGHND